MDLHVFPIPIPPPASLPTVVLLKSRDFRNSLASQWLGDLCAFTAEGVGSAPGRGSKIPQAMWHGQKNKLT